jgi:hypothetical protein
MQFRIATLEDSLRIWEFCKSHDFTEEGISGKDFVEFIKLTYFENPVSKHYQIVAEEGNEIVGHEATTPFSYYFYGKEIILGLGSNLLVHEKFRMMLTFLQMQNYFFKNYRNHGIDFTYGLVTRKEVLSIHLRTGYKKIVDVHVFARPYKIKKILNREIKSKFLKLFLNPFIPIGNFVLSFFPGFANSKILVSEEEVFKPEWDNTIKAQTAEFLVTGVRNAKILNWRFRSLSYRKYYILVAYKNNQYCGYAVVRQMNMQEFSTLALVDILCNVEEENIFKTLLGEVHRLALKLNVDLVSTILSPYSKFLPYFKKRGFLKTPEYFTLVADQPNDSIIHFPADIEKDWHVNWFDHDYV